MLASLAISCSVDPRTDTAMDASVPFDALVALTAEAIAEMSDMLPLCLRRPENARGRPPGVCQSKQRVQPLLRALQRRAGRARGAFRAPAAAPFALVHAGLDAGRRLRARPRGRV